MAEFKRARNAKAKEVRRHSILEAAATLFKTNPTALPTTSQISSYCDISKGALYLYFKSKEEIFLAIIEAHFLEWLNIFDIKQQNNKQQNLDTIVLFGLLDKACTYIQDNPIFLQLACMSNSVIEPNVDSKILLHHKNHLGLEINKVAHSLADNTKLLTHSQIASLLMRSYATLLGLWQISHPLEPIAKVLQSSSMHVITPDFPSTSRDMLKDIWQLAIQANKPEKSGLLGKLFSR